MAHGTLYLRPSEDISLNHTVYPNTLSSGYLAINEKVSDGSTTYIGFYNMTTDSGIESDTSCTSKFKMSLSNTGRIVRATSAKFGFDGVVDTASTNGTADTAECMCTVFVNGNEVFSGKCEEYINMEGSSSIRDTLSNVDMPNLITAINNCIDSNGNINMPEVTIDITNTIGVLSSKTAAHSYVSQVYIELECEYIPDIVRKVNGEWKAVSDYYKKINGAWSYITRDEYKSILQSNIVIDKCKCRGHIETPIADVAATCLDTGMTGGIYCTFCGETLKEHDTTQLALGHDFNDYTGKCLRCTERDPNSITFTILRNVQTSATTYYAMPNVTWGEWASAQTTTMFGGGWQITSDGKIRYYYTLMSTIDYIIDNVTKDDLIISGYAYTATDVVE